MNRWAHSGSTELEARESIWLAMRLLDRIHGHISSIVETGHMARYWTSNTHSYKRNFTMADKQEAPQTTAAYPMEPALEGSLIREAQERITEE